MPGGTYSLSDYKRCYVLKKNQNLNNYWSHFDLAFKRLVVVVWFNVALGFEKS